MKTLTLLRHAKSSWKDASLADRDRPLNRRGQRNAPVMGERIKHAGIRPSLILTSPAVRAWTTARIVAYEIGYPVEFLQRDDRLYHASVKGMLRVIGEQDTGFNHIMVVGHNPGLTDFANYLLPGITSNIPTCGFIAFEIDREDWNLSRNDPVRLLAYDYPKRVANT